MITIIVRQGIDTIVDITYSDSMTRMVSVRNGQALTSNPAEKALAEAAAALVEKKSPGSGIVERIVAVQREHKINAIHRQLYIYGKPYARTDHRTVSHNNMALDVYSHDPDTGVMFSIPYPNTISGALECAQHLEKLVEEAELLVEGL